MIDAAKPIIAIKAPHDFNAADHIRSENVILVNLLCFLST
jgi:hypothetical protein